MTIIIRCVFKEDDQIYAQLFSNLYENLCKNWFSIKNK